MNINLEKSLQNMDGLGVYELREVARRLGVFSPTTKKVGQLKQEIKDILSGKTIVEKTQKKFGRPPKTVNIDKNLVSDLIIPSDIVSLANSHSTESEVENLERMIFNSPREGLLTGVCETKAVEGFLRETSGGHIYFWTKQSTCSDFEQMVFIPEQVSKKLSLRVGDFVLGHAKLYEAKNCFVVETINMINGQDVQQDKPRKEALSISDIILPDKKMEVFGEQLHEGGRVIAFFEDRANCVLTSLEDARKKHEEGYVVVFLGLELPPEFSALLASKEWLIKFVSKFGDSLQSLYSVVQNCINNCNTRLLDGERIVLYVYDIVGILEILNLYFRNDKENIASGLQITKSIFGLGKCVKGGSSISVVSLLSNLDKENEFVKKDLSKVASCVISNL